MENKVKYYTNSKGEKIDVSTLHTTHLINALSKKYNELFTSTDKDDYSKKLEEINNLKEDLYGRFNNFYENLGDNNE